MILKNDINKILFTLGISTGILSFTLGLFAPLNIYTNNINEYKDQFITVLNTCFLISLGLWFLLFICIFLISYIGKFINKTLSSKMIVQFISTILCITSVLFWLQGNVLTIDYGVLNGIQVNWDKFRIPIIFGAIFWFWTLLLTAYYYKKIIRWIIPLVTVLFVMQSANLIYEFITLPQLASFKTHSSDESIAFNISPKQNIILIMLDSFQSDIFEEIITYNQQQKINFNDFTYYRNVSGGYPTTYASIPLIMTGQFYRNQMPIQDFIKESYMAESLPKNLQDMGYVIHFECNQMFYCNPQISNSIVKIPRALLLNRADIKNYYIPSIIRYIPGIVYKIIDFYNHNTNNVNHNFERHALDSHLYNQIINNTIINSEKRTFNFFHFIAPHPPFYLNSSGQYESQAHNRQGQLNHSSGALLYAVNLINKMKNLGIYNNSLILILSDHGFGPLGFKPNTDVDNSVIITNPIFGGAMPLLLVKPFYTKGEIVIDETSISYSTLAKDILNYLNAYNTDNNARFIPTVTPIRKYYFYTWNNMWNNEYLPDMTEYQIEGHVRDQNAWKATGNIYKTQK